MDQRENISDETLDLASMSEEQERSIFEAVRGGDQSAAERLLQSGTAFISEVADRCESSIVSFQELFAEMHGNLYAAISNFRCSGEERFVSHLQQLAEECVRRCYARIPQMLPIDYRVVQLHDRYKMALYELYPDNEERESFWVHDEEYVADYLGVTREELRAAIVEYDLCQIHSLDEKVYLDDPQLSADEREVPLVDLIAVSNDGDERAADYLDTLMDCLNAVERYVVCSKSGVFSTPERTDKQIAAKFGVSCKTVGRLYRQSLGKIRKAGKRRFS